MGIKQLSLGRTDITYLDPRILRLTQGSMSVRKKRKHSRRPSLPWNCPSTLKVFWSPLFLSGTRAESMATPTPMATGE